MTGEGLLLNGDCRDVLAGMGEQTVDLVVTSPPYFALRAYQDGGEAYGGQIGAEESPEAFVGALTEVTELLARVLKPTGSIWVNLGDKFGPDKGLMGIPWRYALACRDDLGLILRNEVIWEKLNSLPEPVSDRTRRNHEHWFHFVKSKTYYSALDELREPYAPSSEARMKAGFKKSGYGVMKGRQDGTGQGSGDGTGIPANGLGRPPGSVWGVSTGALRIPEELGVAHFAAFPEELPRRIIVGWSPREICDVCGEGRKPVTSKQRDESYGSGSGKYSGNDWNEGKSSHQKDRVYRTITTIESYACSCPNNTGSFTPGVVLDPFAGTGTTVAVAKALGRTGIGIEMSADYMKVAEWRVNGGGYDKVVAKISGSAPKKPVDENQQSLFG